MFATHGGKGIGVVGLCLTGNFALAMMADGTFERHDLEPPHLFAHPVFTVSYDDKSCEISRAFERLVEFLAERLGRPPRTQP
jgi:hypothetical protein